MECQTCTILRVTCQFRLADTDFPGSYTRHQVSGDFGRIKRIVGTPLLLLYDMAIVLLSLAVGAGLARLALAFCSPGWALSQAGFLEQQRCIRVGVSS